MRSWVACFVVLILLISLVIGGRVTNPRKAAQSVPNYHGVRGLFSNVRSRLSNVYVSNSNVFPYYDISLAEQTEGFVPEYTLSNDYGEKASTFHYFSGDIMDDKFANLRNELDLSETVQRIIKSKDILSRLTANLWVGDASVVTTAHYDSVYNIYLQVEGTKRFSLLPPTAAHALQVHGRMHPYACQSRVANLTTGRMFLRRPYCVTGPCNEGSNEMGNDNRRHTEGREAEYISSARANLVQYTLHPGDVLVIPPYWFHEVETLTDAVAVSLWWDAAQLDVMDEVYALPLPFEEDWAEDLLLRAVGEFASELLSATVAAVEAGVAQTCMPGITVDSLRRLLRVRYLEDVAHREWHRTHQELLLDDSTTQRLRTAAGRRANLFVKQFLSWDMFTRSEDLHLMLDEASEVDWEEVAARADLVAVLAIKLCDYVEDVFRHVSEMLFSRGSSKFTETQGKTSGTSRRRGLNAVAVELLLQWLQSSNA